HRDVDAVDRIILLNRDADRFVSLGDSEMREHELSARNVYGVRGNYPFEPDFPYELTTVFAGWKTFLTHGHRYYVKNGLSQLSDRAAAETCDIVCFGHTHQPYLAERAGVLFVNPGSAATPRSGLTPTYAIIEATEDEVRIAILDLDHNIPLHTLRKRRTAISFWR
ncbi:MAG: metallophosphoesterase, partial [bacterium]